MTSPAKAPLFERSIATITDMEFRAAESGDGTRFSGYAAVFNAASEPLPFIETIAPGAFARSVKAGGQTFVVDHDDTKLLGSVRAKTLNLSEDSKGLLVDAALPDTS
jgi:HK97 family phage prohead protease